MPGHSRVGKQVFTCLDSARCTPSGCDKGQVLAEAMLRAQNTAAVRTQPWFYFDSRHFQKGRRVESQPEPQAEYIVFTKGSMSVLCVSCVALTLPGYQGALCADCAPRRHAREKRCKPCTDIQNIPTERMAT